jgi:hypothetical protein
VPVVASSAVAPRLRTPATGRVLAVFPAAVYVRLDDGTVLALVTSDGLRLPSALVVAAAAGELPFARHRAGATAAVADGALLLDGVRYRSVRTWTPRSTTDGALRADAVEALAGRLPPSPHTGEVAVRLATGAGALAAALRTGTGLERAADLLLGLGPGLTPAGDDLLAGVLLTSAHLGTGLPSLSAHVRQRADATTALSADLLGHAAGGRAAPPVLGLLDALTGRRPVGPALTELVALGSTSGFDTATGVLLAARSLLGPA